MDTGYLDSSQALLRGRETMDLLEMISLVCGLNAGLRLYVPTLAYMYLHTNTNTNI